MGNKRQNESHFVMEDITGEFPCNLVSMGNSWYLRLKPAFIRFWDLKPGDILQIRMVKVKRKIVDEEE